jgi:hypothetical protein
MKHSTATMTGLSLLAVCLCVVFGSGCRSTHKPDEARFASVEIQGNTPGQIGEMAAEVFQDNGYLVASANPAELIFEKKASGWNNFAYGNWTEPVWVRVTAAVVPVSEMTFRLQCHAVLLRDRGDTTEEQIKISSLRSHTYQKLLNEVATRLSDQSDFDF